MAEPWQKPGSKAPSFYPELWETEQRATVKFDSIGGMCWVYPSFSRLNLPFGHQGYADDSTVNDYLFVQYGKSPAPVQIRDAPGVEPVWAEFRDKMLDLAKAKLPAQCVCCCCSMVTAPCWVPFFISSYTTALEKQVEEWKPKFAAVGVKIEFFNKSGTYSWSVSQVMGAKTSWGQKMVVIGFTLMKGEGPVPAVPVQIERD